MKVQVQFQCEGRVQYEGSCPGLVSGSRFKGSDSGSSVRGFRFRFMFRVRVKVQVQIQVQDFGSSLGPG